MHPDVYSVQECSRKEDDKIQLCISKDTLQNLKFVQNDLCSLKKKILVGCNEIMWSLGTSTCGVLLE